MRRTTSLTAAGLLGLALLATPLGAAEAAGETCRGLPATIVGTGTTVTGTEGPDVVVTGSAGTVETLGGDDVVCVSPGDPSGSAVSVDVGHGNDVVDAGGATDRQVSADLGPGVDEFVGGASNDLVSLSYPDVAGLDRVDAGAGVDTLDLAAAGDGTVDVAARTLSIDGTVVASVSQVEDHLLRPTTPGSAWRFDGSPGPDVVAWYPLRAPGASLQGDLGAGDDQWISDGPPGPGSAVAAGPGTDALYLPSRRPIDLDLDAGVLAVGSGAAYEIGATGFEDADLFARRVTVRGTPGPNRVGLTACRATVRLGAGDDVVERQYDVLLESDLMCTERLRASGGGGDDRLSAGRGPAVLTGGSGADVLRGGHDSDRLVGGAGRDRADGRSGRDRCLAERERRCER